MSFLLRMSLESNDFSFRFIESEQLFVDIGFMLESLRFVRESQWKFVTAGGGSLGVSTPIARVGVNAGGGAQFG